MRRKLLGAVTFVVLLVLTIVVYFGRCGGDDKPASKPAPAPAASTPAPARPAQANNAKPPMTPAMQWVIDEDRDGPLRLEGQVLDESGDPVGGATVTLLSVPPRTATTEADGGFAFDKLVGREYGLSAVAGDKVAGPVTHRLTATSQPAVLHLGPGGKLAVTVVDTTSKPIAKATVGVLPDGKTGTTGDDGIATLSPLHIGWQSVQASAPGFAQSSTYVQVAGGGTTASVTVTLRAGYSIAGRVVDEAGKPIKGARVTTAGVFDIDSMVKPVTTDARGAFQLPALEPGTYVLAASDGDHAPARSQPVTVSDAPVTGVEIKMQEGGVVAGTVVDTTGAPVPFATVRVRGSGQQSYLAEPRQASTDDKGAFELRGVARMKLDVRAEGETAASAVTTIDLTSETAKRDLKLVLDVAGTIAGVVVDDAGQPVPEVQVNAFPDLLAGSKQDPALLSGMTTDTTDGGGQFVIRGLPDGSYRLHAARSSRGRYQWGAQGVPAKTGDKTVRITLSAPGTVTGKLVLEGSNKPPALANVQLGHQPPQPTRPDGTFTITDAEPGTYDLHARGPEFTELTKSDVTVTPDKSTDVGTLTLAKGRTITGRVVDKTGNAVAGAKVRSGDILYSMQGAGEDQLAAFEERAGQRSAVTDKDGNFTLVGVASKRTNVMADHPTKGRSSAIEIPAGTDDPPALTLTLLGYGQITGTVTLQGKPVGGVGITATPKNGGSQVQVVQSAADGTFTLANVSEGTVVLSALLQDAGPMAMKSTSVEVEVTAGKHTKVTLDIPVGSVTLEVDVKPQPGAQVDAAQVFLMRGVIAIKTAKEVNDAFLGGKAVGMKFWFGAGKPAPEFTEIVPGDYSVCSIPITGDLNNSTFQQRLQAHLDVLAVYCKQAKVAAAPAKQTLTQELPSMPPLPQ
jgi:protocatechuate 3,4-dioxygenase beta subunit